LDEQYLACFIECVISGAADPACLKRPKVQRILTENSELQRRIAASMKQDSEDVQWLPETERVRNVILKLARGHAAYELFPQFGDPVQLEFRPLLSLRPKERADFENRPHGLSAPWPEIESRAFHRAAGVRVDEFAQVGDWIVVQPSRYRFAVNETGAVEVRIVLSEYLGCRVSWE
jgi:hypothetical protein